MPSQTRMIGATATFGTDGEVPLDFGGGDGKLLAPFVDAGHDCYLVDYNTEPLPGVKKLADTLDGVDDTFDAIICSHVLEHVADPLGTLRDLRARLRPGGRIYAEVPSEVWRGIPIERDPVTHVNFFTVASFGRRITASLTSRIASSPRPSLA